MNDLKGLERLKLLVTIVDRDKGRAAVSLYRAEHLHFDYLCMGLGTANSVILDYFGLSETEKDVVLALEAIVEPASLQEPVYSDGRDTIYIMDQVKDKKNKEDNWVESLAVNDAMKRLNERENYIIKLRFFEGKTQTEVAEEIHISQAQVSRLEKNALKTMRNYLN